MTTYRRYRQLLLTSLLIGLVFTALHTIAAPRPATAACASPLPASKGTATFTINVPTTGTYRLWTHMYSPAAGSDGVAMRIDDTHCEIRVGDGGNMAAQGFTWVDFRDGKTASKNDFQLTAGSHTLTFAGIDSKVGIDKVLLTPDLSCVPTGAGDNCTSAATATPSGDAPDVQAGGADAVSQNNSPKSDDTIALAAKKMPLTVRLGLGLAGLLLVLVSAGFVLWLRRPDVLRLLLQKLPFLTFLPKLRPVSPVSVNASEGPVVSTMHETPTLQKLWVIVGAVAFGLVGAGLSILAFAANNSASFLMQNAKVSGNAAIVSHQSAIGGKMVQFDVPPSSTTASTGGAPSAPSPGPNPPDSTPPSTPPPTGQSCPAYPAFPDANCTGVPAGVTLTAYSGSCTITAPNTVIDSKTVNCLPLRIHTTGVTIKNSRINGSVSTSGEGNSYSFTITDSEVITPRATAWIDDFTGIGSHNFTALRVEVRGGNRSVNCARNCTVQDSWLHGQQIADSPRIHSSGVRMGQGSKIIHNRLICEAFPTSTDGGCSGNLTGYGDFEAVRDNRIEKNLFLANLASGVCAYGGSSGDDGSKPYGNQAANIVFIDNVFQRGSNGNCAIYLPILDFNSSRPGNQWINNKWDNGAIVPPDR